MAPLLGAQARHDPGGKRLLPLPPGMRGSAIFGGAHDEYRYLLERVWDAVLPLLLVVMMNPSTASAEHNDPTVAKMCRFARRWGYGGLLVVNTFAYRATDQRRLLDVADPIGPENDAHIMAAARRASGIVFAYGKPHMRLRARGPAVADMIEAAGWVPYVLRLCADGTPSHPLYLPESIVPIAWQRQK